MFDAIASRFSGISFTSRDALDILLVAILFYYVYLLVRGTRAVQMLLGILVLAAIYGIARWSNLGTVSAILREVFFYLPFAIIVLFSPDLRRALSAVGRSPLFSMFSRQRLETTINEVVLAATSLGSKRIGALIVIERQEGLRTYVESGIRVDANVSYDLLVNIFAPGTPLHDGAAIVHEDRIAAAACFLPLTANPELSKEFGTRHRAAIGITEETDALAVVVSEETGIVSLAVEGKLYRYLDAKSLRDLLFRHAHAAPERHRGEEREARP